MKNPTKTPFKFSINEPIPSNVFVELEKARNP